MLAAIETVSQVGDGVLRSVAEFGRFVDFCRATVHGFVFKPHHWARWRLLGRQFFMVGVATIPVVAITGAFIGMVIALESFAQFQSIGQEGRLGSIINVSVTKQIGPVLAAVMVAGRVGCALAAELGTMRVTEQLDAMRAMAADPIIHLVVPRVLACVVMTPLLTIYSDLLGVWGGWLITVQLHEVSQYDYWQYSASYIDWWDPASGLVKSFFFGASIGLIACYKGFTCRPGAAGVGRAATEAFVYAFLAIITLNLVLAETLNTIIELFLQKGPGSVLG